MTFKEIIADDLDAVFYNEDEFAFSAEYKGSPVLLIEDGEQARVEQFPGFHVLTMNVRVRKVDFPQPRINDAILIEGAVWRIGEGMTGDAGEWFLLLVKDEIT